MDREIISELRAANEACMTLLTLMTLDDDQVTAAKFVAEDDRFTERSTAMALAGFAISAASALADQLKMPVETVIQLAATNAAQHVIDLEDLMEQEENDEGLH